jgi:hypothetical protein
MIEIGELKTFTQKFTTSAGVDTDPAFVQLWLREEIDGTELQWTYTTSGAVTTSPTGFSSVIVRDSAGDFHLDFNARKAERITAQWVGTGTVSFFPPETVFVRHSLITALDP